MSYDKHDETINAITAKFTAIVPHLGVLSAEGNSIRDGLDKITGHLQNARKKMEKGLSDDVIEQYNFVIRLLPTCPDQLIRERDWMVQIERDKDDHDLLLARIAGLIGDLDDITDWCENHALLKLKQQIADDLQEMHRIGTLKPACTRALSFLAIRVMEAAIDRLKVKAGRTPDSEDRNKFPVDGKLCEHFRELDCVFAPKVDQVYSERNLIIHVGAQPEKQPPLRDFLIRMLKLYRLLWRDRKLGEALETISRGCDDYLQIIHKQIEEARGAQRIADKIAHDKELERVRAEHEVELKRHDELARKERGKALIQEKENTLKEKDNSFNNPVSDVQSCGADGAGLYRLYDQGSAAIHWHVRTGVGAIATKEPIRSKWKELGWEDGHLGYPTGGEQPISFDEYVAVLAKLSKKQGRFTGRTWRHPLKASEYGRYSVFEKGSIYWIGLPWQKEIGQACVAFDNRGVKLGS